MKNVYNIFYLIMVIKEIGLNKISDQHALCAEIPELKI